MNYSGDSDLLDFLEEFQRDTLTRKLETTYAQGCIDLTSTLIETMETLQDQGFNGVIIPDMISLIKTTSNSLIFLQAQLNKSATH